MVRILFVSCVNRTRQLMYLHDVLVSAHRCSNVQRPFFCFYGVACGKNFSKGSLNKLRYCYHKCIKILFGYPKFHSDTAILLELSLYSFCTNLIVNADFVSSGPIALTILLNT